ncbi:hypothetical protein GCM10028784_08470 [Myceligenerans cantabricum]
MSLWGPALDAEVEYRAEQARKAWGGRPRPSAAPRRRRRREKATEVEKRTAQIRRGVWGMRPEPAPRGLFA